MQDSQTRAHNEVDGPASPASAFDAQLDAFARPEPPRARRRVADLAEAGAMRLEAVWSGLADYVRRQGAALGKRVELVATGGELEISGQAGEALRPALVHLVRNACSDRVETPAARQGAGKPGLAILRLSARRSGGRVQVTLADDGRGVDAYATEPKPVVSEAFEIDPSVDRLPEARGAGSPARAELELVRGAVEKAGGEVALSSTPGRGAAFTLTLPGPSPARARASAARPAA